MTAAAEEFQLSKKNRRQAAVRREKTSFRFR
jgi:hypothetical protein